jgi:ribose 5-phosphate isomerase RpiB
MRIIITENKIDIHNRDKKTVTVDYGTEDIARVGFSAVDYAVEQALKIRDNDEGVMVEGTGVEAKMIARKIEDKIRSEVAFTSGTQYSIQ